MTTPSQVSRGHRGPALSPFSRSFRVCMAFPPLPPPGASASGAGVWLQGSALGLSLAHPSLPPSTRHPSSLSTWPDVGTWANSPSRDRRLRSGLRSIDAVAKRGREHGGPGPIREGFLEQVTFAYEQTQCVSQRWQRARRSGRVRDRLRNCREFRARQESAAWAAARR